MVCELQRQGELCVSINRLGFRKTGIRLPWLTFRQLEPLKGNADV